MFSKISSAYILFRFKFFGLEVFCFQSCTMRLKFLWAGIRNGSTNDNWPCSLGPRILLSTLLRNDSQFLFTIGLHQKLMTRLNKPNKKVSSSYLVNSVTILPITPHNYTKIYRRWLYEDLENIYRFNLTTHNTSHGKIKLEI